MIPFRTTAPDVASSLSGWLSWEALVEKLQEALDRTQRALEEVQRSGKRQAAPFRKKKVSVR
jgi:hypothetical protein